MKKQIDWKKVIRAELDRLKNLQQSPNIRECAIGYIDQTDFRHELGESNGGVTIYSSVEDTLKCCPCAKECGVVKVLIELSEVVLPRNDKIGSCDDASMILHYREQADLMDKRSALYRSLADNMEKEQKPYGNI